MKDEFIELKIQEFKEKVVKRKLNGYKAFLRTSFQQAKLEGAKEERREMNFRIECLLNGQRTPYPGNYDSAYDEAYQSGIDAIRCLLSLTPPERKDV